RWIPSDDLEGLLADTHLRDVDGVVVPGGFGVRGIEGKISAVRFAREHDIPFLGLCLGLQCAVIEFARSQLGLTEANSAEFDPMTPHPVIDLMATQKGVEDLGGTMRLGLYPARLDPKSRSRDLYGEDVVYERHRHRYEVNNRYRQDLEAAGMLMAGVSPDDQLVEVIELPSHPFFVASQFHPEFKSRPDDPHPLFAGFMRAAAERLVETPGTVVDLPQAAVDRR
ncbi:MAG TPA: CTP synthase, partial [Acidimicrobiia bacterium]|nr:CTP synthase [Acidimicrobiia bacterium]